MKKWSAIGLLSAMIVTATGCGLSEDSAQPAQERTTPVQVALVQKGSLQQRNEIIATARPNAEVNIAPKMNGELTQLHVDKNSIVKKGDTLGKIDDKDLQIQLELERISLDQLQLQYKNMQRLNPPQAEIDQAQASIEQARLRLQLAQNRVQDAVIKAPISGTVVQLNAKAGETVSAASPLFTIVSIDPIQVAANVSTNQMLALQNNQEVELHFPDIGKTGTAAITFLSPVANQAGFYALEAEMPNPKGEIKPGMGAKIVLTEQVVQDALLVPTEAVIERGGKTYVFVVENDAAVEKEIEVEQTQTEMSAIKGELNEGDQVVVRGQITLVTGNKVNIIEEEK